MDRGFLGTLALACLASIGGEASACCMASPAGKPVWLTEEKVIIVWDAERKVEHFIRQANFNSEAKDFGFIVPTPSVPDFGVVNEGAFDKLAALIPPDWSYKMEAASGAVTSAPARSVEVLKQERVGDYQATVLKATDGAAMNAWLKKNGYESRPAMTEWLDGYAKKQWVFTALKYASDPDRFTETNALRLSFKTDQPHYPYKMPKDTWPEGWMRPLTVFFISSTPAESRYVGSDKHWEAKTKWTGPLPDRLRMSLAADLSLKESDLPKDAKVTVFINETNPDGYDRDLVFGTVQNLSPWLWGGGAVVGLVVLAGLRKRIGRSPVPAPA